MRQVERFLKYYDESQILVVKAEDLYRDRIAALSKVFKFLNVDASFRSEQFEKIYNSSARKRANRAFTGMIDPVPVLSKALNWASRSPGLSQILTRRLEKPELGDSHLKRLAKFYFDDIVALEQFASMNCSDWKNTIGL